MIGNKKDCNEVVCDGAPFCERLEREELLGIIQKYACCGAFLGIYISIVTGRCLLAQSHCVSVRLLVCLP